MELYCTRHSVKSTLPNVTLFQQRIQLYVVVAGNPGLATFCSYFDDTNLVIDR